MEAAQQLDLSVLQRQGEQLNVLTVSAKKKPIWSKSPERYILLIEILIILLLIIDLISDSNGRLVSFTHVVVILILTRQKFRSHLFYKIDENGLQTPYFWFLSKKIQWDEIIDIYEEKVSEQATDLEFFALRVTLDTSLLKFNTSGLEEPSILFSEKDFAKQDLDDFFTEFKKFQRLRSATPNTQGQRLTDQVNRAWNGRWKLIFMNIFDSATEFAFYLYLVYLMVFYTVELNIWPNLIGILLGSYTFLLLIFHYIERPTSIIGFRANELGPIVYNENDVVSNIRFLVMSKPHPVELTSCELVYDENELSRSAGNLHQLHPKEIAPGELTHSVAQFLGNHTKSKGVIVTFNYKNDKEAEFQLPIIWA